MSIIHIFTKALGFVLRSFENGLLSSSPSSSEELATIPSNFRARCHPKVSLMTKEVDGYFLKTWDFKNEKDKKKFVAAGFSRVTCFYYPTALDDRIGFACRLLTVLFLIDDLLEDMSFEEGEAYNNNLMPICRGDVRPDRTKPAELINYDLWEEMRSCDKELANEILEPVFTFMRAQTDRTRLNVNELGAYLEYREKDVGKELLSALGRFVMNLHLSQDELATVRDIEQNCSKHISVINDIYSWEKELEASKTGHEEGAAICSAVQIFSDEAKLSVPAAKRALYFMCREWELCHNELMEKRRSTKCSLDLFAHIKGLEYQMSGNEEWSRTTKRYRQTSVQG